MQVLRLRQLFTGVFMKANKATINMLRLVEPYIAYGYPNRKSVKELIYKRGFGKVKKSRIPLDNDVIEEVQLCSVLLGSVSAGCVGNQSRNQMLWISFIIFSIVCCLPACCFKDKDTISTCL